MFCEKDVRGFDPQSWGDNGGVLKGGLPWDQSGKDPHPDQQGHWRTDAVLLEVSPFHPPLKSKDLHLTLG